MPTDRPDESAGEALFAILKDAWTVALLHALHGSARTREELAAELTGVSRAGLTRRLGRLGRAQIVQSRRFADSYGRVRYSLTGRGVELLALVDEIATAWQGAREGEQGAARGLAAVLAGGRRTRAVARALVEGPLSFSELARRVPHIANAPLTRHLRRLQQAGLVRKRHDPDGRPLYELTDDARRFGRAATLMARWRWRHMPQGAPPLIGDLQGLVHLVAPLARTAPGVAGMCLLRHSAPRRSRWPDVYVSVADGRLCPLALGLPGPVDARAQADAVVWCDTLLTGDTSGVAVEGDRELFEALIGGLARALAA